MINTIELSSEEFYEYMEKSCSAFGLLTALYHVLDAKIRAGDIEPDDMRGYFIDGGYSGVKSELGFEIPHEELDILYEHIGDGVGNILLTLARQHADTPDNVVSLATVRSNKELH